MCTVSFIPSGARAIITSNRDEHISRKAPLRPIEETINGVKVAYPKDRTAGGTWFAINEVGTVAVLLNGAFQNHHRTPPYRKSRGLLLLDIISVGHSIDMVREINLENIEPFTLVLFEKSTLWEFRWDGTKKYLIHLDSAKSYIWSSWTLYDSEAQASRESCFQNFIAQNNFFDRHNILAFHKENHGDFENGYLIDRDNGLKTLSVTQVISEKDQTQMHHLDLATITTETVFISKASSLIARS